MHVYSMVRKLIPCFLLFVTSLTPLYGANIRFFHHPELGIAFQINKEPRFSDKMQVEENIGYGFALLFFEYFGIDLSFRVTHVHNSSIRGGFQYRGYLSLGPSAGLFGRVPIGGTLGAWRIFTRFHPAFATYNTIDTSFFFLGLIGGTGLELQFTETKDWFLVTSLSVSINLRRDLTYSLAPGVLLSLHHQLLPWPYKKEGTAE